MRALVIGGTQGLGMSLVRECFDRRRMQAGFIRPIAAGRSADFLRCDPTLAGAEFCAADLCKPAEAVAAILASCGAENINFIFWVAGILKQKPFAEFTLEDIRSMVDTHATGPYAVLAELHRRAIRLQQPYHLVTISSTSSWRLRNDETMYCALKAAKSAWSRNFFGELIRDLPGSKLTLIHPGGMKTDLFKGSRHDTTFFMDPEKVAQIIWDEVLGQQDAYGMFHVLRTEKGAAWLSRTPISPENPSDI